jgi:ABC-type multidrug transport system permease subunit
MENQLSENVSQLHCAACSSIIRDEDFFCQHCGFPIKAPAEERDAFINSRNLKAYELSEMQKKIKNASTSIFVIGGFTAFLALVLYFTAHDKQDGLVLCLVNLVVAGIFLALGFWCKSQPVAAIISALSLYALLWIVSIIENPLNIVSGIIIKIVLIVYLIKGLNSAFEAQKIKKAHNL